MSNREEILLWIHRLNNPYAHYRNFKFWAFRVAYGRFETHVTLDYIRAFINALEHTADTGTKFENMTTRELAGFKTWYRTIRGKTARGGYGLAARI
jgi:hypothetical protein